MVVVLGASKQSGCDPIHKSQYGVIGSGGGRTSSCNFKGSDLGQEIGVVSSQQGSAETVSSMVMEMVLPTRGGSSWLWVWRN